MMRLVNKIICLFCILLPTPLFAVDYYVDGTNGTDDAGCISSPAVDNECKTISYVISNANLEGGDIVYIQSGTYSENLNITYVDGGSAGNYVTFKSYANENVTITTSGYHQIGYNGQDGDDPSTDYVKFDGRGTDSGRHITVNGTGNRGFVVANANYIWFTGLTIQANSFGYGIYFRSVNNGTDSGAPNTNDDKGAKNCIVEYCYISNNSATNDSEGLKFTGWGTDSNIARYNIITDMRDMGVNVSGYGYQANPPTDNEIYSNSIYAITDAGIGIGVVSYSTGTLIHDNTIYSNVRGISIGSSSTGTVIYNNTIYDSSGYDVFIGEDGALVYNNLIYRTQALSQSIGLGAGCQNSYIYNNSVYTDGDNDNCIWVDSDAGGSNVIKNNILWANYSNSWAIRFESADPTDEVSDVDLNDLYCPNSSSKVANYGGTTKTLAEINTTYSATNVSAAPAWDGSYDLTSSTPASLIGSAEVLSGTFTTDRHGDTRGTAWDMGSDEYAFDSTPSATDWEGFTLTGGTLQ